MLKTKFNILQTILASSTAPQSVSFDASSRRDFSISLTHGAGSGTNTAKLQASNDGSNFFDVTDSSQTLDNAGGGVLWNVIGFQSMLCKVVVSGNVVTCVVQLASN